MSRMSKPNLSLVRLIIVMIQNVLILFSLKSVLDQSSHPIIWRLHFQWLTLTLWEPYRYRQVLIKSKLKFKLTVKGILSEVTESHN